MKISVSETGELDVSELYNGIGIKTDQGLFGVAMRDCGIEVMLDGDMVFQSHEVLPCKMCNEVSTGAVDETDENVSISSKEYLELLEFKSMYEGLCK